ncbi:TadE/TadG family type IV pilus assembly protein [Roseovarius sp. EL26]|uniref:TadE/TadG family type IV pilus assembly protein n=1 Tax=Roseovarius sp. EL26 TaxID=2126672 RepID=UPI000EA208B9|nr:TadE/TadG family type IV pilus assembly protein [Roseovarius sp. EL26]
MHKIDAKETTAITSGIVPLPGQIKRWISRFRRDEDGAMTVLTVFFAIIMLIMAGFGVDMMRYEMHRARVQNTLDAAVLAGAGAASGLNEARIEAVVKDYFSKAGQLGTLNEFKEGDIVTTLNAAKVTASAELTLNTYLMKLLDVNTLRTKGTSTAEVRIPKLEISMVLDVSGSMSRTGSDGIVKLDALKVAAKEFVTDAMAIGDPGDVMISIVPFSFGVTPSLEIFNALNVNRTHNRYGQDYEDETPPSSLNETYCIRFSGNDYNNTAISTSDLLKQRIYSSRYGNFEELEEGSNRPWRTCYTDKYFEILPYSLNKTKLHEKIDGLVANGNTSGHEGIKWGTGLLDPEFQSVARAIDPTLSNIPANYTEPDTLKVIVMMGDGANTSTYQFHPLSEYALIQANGGVSTGLDLSNATEYRGPDGGMYKFTFNTADYQRVQHVNYGTGGEWRASNSTQYMYLCSDDYPQWVCNYDNREYGVEETYMRRPGSNTFYLVEGASGQYRTSRTFNEITSELRGTNRNNSREVMVLDQNLETGGEFTRVTDIGSDTSNIATRPFNQISNTHNNRNDLTNGPYRTVEFTDTVNGVANTTVFGMQQFSWEYMWGHISPEEYSDIISDNNTAYNEFKNTGQAAIGGDSKDDRMEDACNAARAPGKNMVIYTIGFAVPVGGTAERELKKCAHGDTNSTPGVGSYFAASNRAELRSSFGAILDHVQKLRLTQ